MKTNSNNDKDIEILDVYEDDQHSEIDINKQDEEFDKNVVDDRQGLKHRKKRKQRKDKTKKCKMCLSIIDSRCKKCPKCGHYQGMPLWLITFLVIVSLGVFFLLLFQEDIYKNSCEEYIYTNLLDNSKRYKGERAHFFGQVLQKIDTFEYLIDTGCEQSKYSSKYYCFDTLYVMYDGNVDLREDDMVEIWGIMDGVYKYKNKLDKIFTVPKIKVRYVTIK